MRVSGVEERGEGLRSGVCVWGRGVAIFGWWQQGSEPGGAACSNEAWRLGQQSRCVAVGAAKKTFYAAFAIGSRRPVLAVGAVRRKAAVPVGQGYRARLHPRPLCWRSVLALVLRLRWWRRPSLLRAPLIALLLLDASRGLISPALPSLRRRARIGSLLRQLEKSHRLSLLLLLCRRLGHVPSEALPCLLAEHLPRTELSALKRPA